MFSFRCQAAACLIAVSFATPLHAADRPDPTDPDAPVPRLVYRPVMAGYDDTIQTTRPVDWRELNDRMERIGGPRGQLRELDEPIRER